MANPSGTHHTGRRWLGFAVALALAALLLPSSQAEASTAGQLSASLDGRPIALRDVGHYACHDRDYPLIRCFRTAAQLEADEQAPGTASAATAQQLLSPFVRWYQDANYGGAFFEAYDPYPDLSVIGWAKQISSFTPLNGGHPVWWQGPSYTGLMWDWGTVPEATLGNADDQISSVQKW
jgi:hypothetical protein